MRLQYVSFQVFIANLSLEMKESNFTRYEKYNSKFYYWTNEILKLLFSKSRYTTIRKIIQYINRSHKYQPVDARTARWRLFPIYEFLNKTLFDKNISSAKVHSWWEKFNFCPEKRNR